MLIFNVDLYVRPGYAIARTATGSPSKYQVEEAVMRTTTICPSQSPLASKNTSWLPRVLPRHRPYAKPSTRISRVAPTIAA